jgi:hypothetical protein
MCVVWTRLSCAFCWPFRGRVGGSNAKSNYSFLIEIFISLSARPWGRSRKESPYGLDVLRDRWDGYLYRVWGKSFQHPPRRMRWRCQFLRPHLCSLEIRLFEWDLWRFELSGMVTVVLCGGTLWVTGSSGAWVREPLGDRQFWRLARRYVTLKLMRTITVEVLVWASIHHRLTYMIFSWYAYIVVIFVLQSESVFVFCVTIWNCSVWGQDCT